MYGETASQRVTLCQPLTCVFPTTCPGLDAMWRRGTRRVPVCLYHAEAPLLRGMLLFTSKREDSFRERSVLHLLYWRVLLYNTEWIEIDEIVSDRRR